MNSTCPHCDTESTHAQVSDIFIGLCENCTHVWPEDTKKKSKRCPACKKRKIDVFKYTSSRGLRLDSCEACRINFIMPEEIERIYKRHMELQGKADAATKKYRQLLEFDSEHTERKFESFNQVSRFNFVNKILKKLFRW